MTISQWLKEGTEEHSAYRVLDLHAERQRKYYEEEPVFRTEPFTLRRVYTETDCGKLFWEQIKPPSEQAVPSETERGVDPFSEKITERRPLLKTVIELLKDPDLHDAVVIQGVAGSGKSSFTRRLCVALLEEGLRPIRVRIRDLALDVALKEDLQQAIFNDSELDPDKEEVGPLPQDLFLSGTVFEEPVQFGKARICPYVIILDGWDEVVSTKEGFTKRIDKMLQSVRTELLRQRNPVIRVVLTGRPSEAVVESNFLLKKTPVLTIRPYDGEQLRGYVDKLEAALEDPMAPEGAWELGEKTRFQQVLKKYEDEFKEWLDGSGKSRRLEILGLPLLAHLALFVMARHSGDLEELAHTPTTLYRRLVDLTCEKAGKAAADPDLLEKQAMWQEGELRWLLHQTAMGITVYGRENIPRDELELRLYPEAGNLEDCVDQAEEDHPLSRLMISYYFKGGHSQLGCEFLHKSFREYLFAEGVVEILKWYGRKQKVAPPERPEHEYWKDFDRAKDLRWELSRKLGRALSAQWLTDEIRGHLRALLEWEIGRGFTDQKEDRLGTPTAGLDREGWERVRDGLADLWDWWGEGVHLRPQPTRGKTIDFEKPFVDELVEWAAPQDLDRKSALPSPPRTVAMDGHLGDALCELVAFVHFQVGSRSEPAGGIHPRRYQALVEHEGEKTLAFAPGGGDLEGRRKYFQEYTNRINAVGWKPRGNFPAFSYLRGASFRGGKRFFEMVPLMQLSFAGADLVGADLRRAGLILSLLVSTNLAEANLAGAFLYFAFLSRQPHRRQPHRRQPHRRQP